MGHLPHSGRWRTQTQHVEDLQMHSGVRKPTAKATGYPRRDAPNLNRTGSAASRRAKRRSGTAAKPSAHISIVISRAGEQQGAANAWAQFAYEPVGGLGRGDQNTQDWPWASRSVHGNRSLG